MIQKENTRTLACMSKDLNSLTLFMTEMFLKHIHKIKDPDLVFIDKNILKKKVCLPLKIKRRSMEMIP